MKLKKIVFFSLIVFLICIIQNSAKAENDPVMITLSNDKENLVFDGKWSNVNEWKQSSLNELVFEDKNKIILRTAHQGDFIYILIDAISDFNLDKGADKAIVCFDANNDKTTIAGEDDFCLGVSLGNNNGFVLQGGQGHPAGRNRIPVPGPQRPARHDHHPPLDCAGGCHLQRHFQGERALEQPDPVRGPSRSVAAPDSRPATHQPPAAVREHHQSCAPFRCHLRSRDIP